MKLVIDFAFESYIAGQSTGYIAQELNRRGWQYKETEWRGTFVAKLIRDRRLIGDHIRYSKQIKGVKREIVETIPDFYPVVVERDTFNLANNMLTSVAENIRGRTRITYGDTSVLKNLFSGVIKCGRCGGDTTVVKNSRAGTAFIRCRTKYELKTCKQRDVKYDTIERVILNHLKGLDLSLLLTKPVDNKTELWKSELELCINDEIEYRRIIDERRANNKRIRPETLQSLEDVQDRIDELRQKIDLHVEDNFVPDFQVDMESICDINNVRERSLVRKGINAIAEKILYKRMDRFLIIEIKYSNKEIKHILVIDNKSAELVVNFSIENLESEVEYRCNHFIVSYEKGSEVFRKNECSIFDYMMMMNYIDLVDDIISKELKEWLNVNLDNVLRNTKYNSI
ncbi:recombinase zinc beta ribbon domain-containing protein [Mangrovibacter sp. SLW1]